jgi:hypothetical protein
MTSNVGAQLLQKDTSIGFRAGAPDEAARRPPTTSG